MRIRESESQVVVEGEIWRHMRMLESYCREDAEEEISEKGCKDQQSDIYTRRNLRCAERYRRMSYAHAQIVHRSRVAPTVNPAPTEASRTRSPFFKRPSSRAVCMARGMVPAVVFP